MKFLLTILYSPDKTIKIMKQGFHMLHHDTEKESLKQMVLEWMRARVHKNMPSSKVGKKQHSSRLY